MRTLGIDPNSKGVGYAVLESQDKLIDWGVKYLSKQHEAFDRINTRRTFRHKSYMSLVEGLIKYYAPHAILLEDWTTNGCRRSLRTKRILYQASLLAARLKIPCYVYSRAKLRNTFAKYEAPTKHDIVLFLGQLHPELIPVMPRKRKPWMSDSVWMNMFIALAYCFMFAEKNE